jgi:hypothetical protein
MPLEDMSMSKYSEIYEDNHDGGELYCLKYEGSHIYDVIAWIERRDETIEIQAAALESQSNEIAALQRANAELLQQLESEREERGKLKQFIRYTFPLQDPSDIRYANKDAQIFIALWEAEKQKAEQLALGLEAPDSAKGSGE